MRGTPGLLAILLAVPALGACSGSNAATAEDGPAGTKRFTVGAFDSVTLSGSDNVRVVTGTTIGVTAEGPSQLLERLDIRVEGTALKIGRKPGNWGMNWSSGPGVTVTVTTPGIKAAAIGGSGNMSVDKVRGEKFEASIGGSGDLELADVDVLRTSISIAGSGGARATGKTAAVAVSVAGSGDVDATRLNSETADISVAGSGDVRAAASKSAKISLVGSGDVDVKGTKDCEISKIGSGEARCAP